MIFVLKLIPLFLAVFVVLFLLALLVWAVGIGIGYLLTQHKEKKND